MPFKIVETIERGRRLIETVPSSWESDGNLYWPRKNFISLKKNVESSPQSDWKCLPCILLRNNILDYKAAEQEIVLMSDATDTDDKENENPRNKAVVAMDLNTLVMECIQLSNIGDKATPMVTPQGTLPMVIAEETLSMVAAEDTSSVTVIESNTLVPMDVNNITLQHRPQEDKCNPTKITVIQDSILDPNENLLLSDSNQRFDCQIAASQTNATDSMNVAQQIGYLIAQVSTVQENQKVIFEILQNICKTVALTNTKLEEFITRSQGLHQHERYEKVSSFKLINSVEELIAFEEQLKNPLMETKYIQELSIIGNEKKSGINNAYLLVDAMFDRKLMTHCSWGGGTKGKPKQCFKQFTKTINLFLNVVRQYDKKFTKPLCEDFFKNVLRHSPKRNLAKRVRQSTTKKKYRKNETINELQEHCADAGAEPSNDSI